jgi:catechol 2,3-dioxygenase-like lactoylglutathione lyase family enzyme
MATKKKAAKKAAMKKPARKAAKAKKPAAKKSASRPAARKSAAKAAPKIQRRQPETLRIAETSPGYTVNDLQASIAFYRDILGMIIEEEWKRDGVLVGVGLKAGATSFMIGQDDWAKGRDRQKGVGFRIYCTTTQDIDQLAAGIEARGGRLDSQPTDQPWKVRDFTITDPDGFKITIGADL